MKALKVLVVDDDEALATVVQQTLDREGYQTRCACSAAEAYNLFLGFRPGLMISDLQMPGENGVQLIRRIRKITKADLRIIYMSGDLGKFRSELNEERESFRARLLPKPFARIDLLRLVAEIEKSMEIRAA